MLDLQRFKERKIQELESTNPQRLAYFKLGIDSLIAGVQELAKLGMVIQVEDATPSPMTEAERAALMAASGGGVAPGAGGNFLGSGAATAIAQSIVKAGAAAEPRTDMAPGEVAAPSAAATEVAAGQPLVVPPGGAIERVPVPVAPPAVEPPPDHEFKRKDSSPPMAAAPPPVTPPVTGKPSPAKK